MPELVNRLRWLAAQENIEYVASQRMCVEAADEIEHLRAALAAAQATQPAGITVAELEWLNAHYYEGFAAGIEAAASVNFAKLIEDWGPDLDLTLGDILDVANAIAAVIRALRPPAAAGAQVRYIDGMTLGGEPLADWQQLGKQTTEAMRKRVRELATPPRDDFDRAVLCCLNDLEKRIEASAQAGAQPSEEELVTTIRSAWSAAAEDAPGLARIAARTVLALLRQRPQT